MFRFAALFALVAVAAAEPQWLVDATHMKTVSGDTVSVAAAKAHHHQLKAAEYVKKGYAFGTPLVYSKPAVAYTMPTAAYAAPAYAMAAPTYAAGVPAYTQYAAAGVPAYSHGVYSGYPHHVFKREAEAEADSDSQMVYSPYTAGYTGYTGYGGYGGYATAGLYGNMYNAARVAYPATYSAGVYSPYVAHANTAGVYSPYVAHANTVYRGKREAEAEADSDSQYVYGAYPHANKAYYNAGVYNTGVYGAHAGVYNTGVYGAHAGVYNTGVYGANTGYTGYASPYTYGYGLNRAYMG